ncbi:hypothetical protein [Natrialba swarupiae]|uniref:Uncharacterized protein n=1 Tax=Natrialba swarupiae TaxID=2448032 RepID=A0A5D5APN1_9EURY|nr:hypothetical protein [Natrialba swarupiae]MCW8173422.1 hypothetical protein [Natrialba swarupiae]TYT61702.1 hypothetical protein FYC77_12615 [Natrialba swarupiae]
MSTIDRLAGRLNPRLRIEETRAAMLLVVRRYDSLATATIVTIGYLVAFLWAVGDLAVRPDVAAGLIVVDDPLGRLFDRTGPASFEAVAMVDTGFVRILVSPMNVAIGLLLATLVGINLGLTYLAVVQPSACGISAGSGLLASFPALLSGTVCCGPVVLIALGIQASGLLLTMFAWLLPAGILLLLLSVAYVAGTIDTTGVTT